MTQRLIALAAALTFAVSSIAQAAPLPSSSAKVGNSAAVTSPATAWVDPPAKMPVKRPVTAAVVPPEANTQNMTAISTPSAPVPAPGPQAVAPAEPPALARKAAAAPSMRVPSAQRHAVRPRVVHPARYAGGDGGAWRTGRDSFGFTGSFGGCRITGFAGPNGYRLSRVC